MDEIWNNIWLGNIDDALAFDKKDGAIVTLLEDMHTEWNEFPVIYEELKQKHAFIFPILDDEKAEFKICELEAVAKFEKRWRKSRPEGKLLFHCWSGMERSPFAVAWVLFRNYNNDFPTLKIAYDFVKSKRSIVQDRMDWLPSWLWKI